MAKPILWKKKKKKKTKKKKKNHQKNKQTNKQKKKKKKTKKKKTKKKKKKQENFFKVSSAWTSFYPLNLLYGHPTLTFYLDTVQSAYNPCHAKTCLRAYAIHEGPDQPAHSQQQCARNIHFCYQFVLFYRFMIICGDYLKATDLTKWHVRLIFLIFQRRFRTVEARSQIVYDLVLVRLQVEVHESY